MRIYVAGPYSADTAKERLANVNRAIDIGIELMKKGHAPYIPHLTHYIDKRHMFTWKQYMKLDLEFLELCDALFFIAPSPGAMIEINKAKHFGMKIFYSLDKVNDNSNF